MKSRLLRPLALAALCLALTIQSLHAQPAPTGALDPLAAHWRATSRFGYGPAPGSPAPGQPQGRAWALAELDRAIASTRQGAPIPDAMRGFDAPLPQLYAQQKVDTEARRNATGGQRPTVRFAQGLVNQTMHWRLAACSRPVMESPLLARMTEFWFNHLNVSSTKFNVQPYIGHYLVHAIRPHALGRFEDLLLASARHPAMLNYLDQARNLADVERPTGPAPARTPTQAQSQRSQGLNENYARELMELHTLGVNGGYTQQDVRELARILSGWTIDNTSDSGFRFVARRHDNGDKRLLGQTIASAGEAEGEQAIRLLARHPATAQRIGLRLAQWFVADEPPPALVQRLRQRYLDTQGDIAAVMRTLIESPETWQARQQLFKTPVDYACSVLTALGGPDDDRSLDQARRFLVAAGQPLLAWPTPDGYKTDTATWLSPEALSRRADFAMTVGRQMTEADTLAPWLPPDQWARIQREPGAVQAGLALASPGFMRK